MQSFYFGVNPHSNQLIAGNVFLFWFLTSIGLLAGVSIYLLGVYPSFRKLKYRQRKQLSKLQGVIFGGGVAILIIGVAYNINWTRFYRMDVQGETLSLQYYYPTRIVRLSRSDIARLDTASAGKGQPCLVLHARDGKRYTAQMMYRSEYRQLVPHLEDLLPMKVSME